MRRSDIIDKIYKKSVKNYLQIDERLMNSVRYISFST